MKKIRAHLEQLAKIAKYIHPSVFEEKISAHIRTVFNLLDTYASQLEVTYEPEDFFPPPRREKLDDRELEFFLYAKDVVPALDGLIDEQIDSENISTVTRLEMEPSFAALEGHYEGTKLWEDISKYKQVTSTYLSVGLKLHKIIIAKSIRCHCKQPRKQRYSYKG